MNMKQCGFGAQKRVYSNLMRRTHIVLSPFYFPRSGNQPRDFLISPTSMARVAKALAAL